ncbi:MULTISPECIES: hypothetical protein [Vibrio]|uniref:Uncharacterized protein n=1 Tax=Vibrio natriegens NBRC 15636 = ATCC 14048 = DSM 759 TaxID=1219067 RepID=A0AAN1CUU7_VIBNA|nr:MULTISPECIES: hypothetical protein [Vibrio]AEX20685.1 hypothetical protein VEJY3_00930 [Vibrio sp. EJY3]ALR16726.1 hypothetical protein PN96_12380 [Vibrio natriegens NBRC 15636 = ATCC 14048 = DSM 759]ANQ11408.1 hypothetical protein BA890_00950 [Vibrio natriegens NBRC 15636 = ATCC 14048 = DSM 759]EPM38971.1 hypothetical protein M272_18510 [Vibrio natriegens NBRC 15636 = ATCC 14048 = DSM 759]MDX6025736.1 hypothetical protein [Vibrio natriegens NBRC 15636 = ATCC 14048 = DSM 759]
MDKAIVLCPANSVTGGPELIHQFVDALTQLNVDAKILYYPFTEKHQTPSAYAHYNVPLATLEECREATVIVPEAATKYLNLVEGKRKIVWWLSVDNYFKSHPNTLFKHIKHWYRSNVTNNPKFLPMDELKQYSHLTQSYYGELFLNQHGISDVFHLSDYLGEEHLTRQVDINQKENVICYNPKKGIETTNKLIAAMPSVKFAPIQNMTAAEVADLLAKSKVYIDFGNHPGKDRIPREAAMAKCIVITGEKGSAGNTVDIAVPKKYKLNESGEGFIDEVSSLVNEVFTHFERSLDDFEFYRNKIREEKATFHKEVADFAKKFL